MKKLKLTFMGTNGWFATNTGNTISTLLETPMRYIVMDAGDGIYHLDELATNWKKPVDIFLSHFHLDHVIGLHILSKFQNRRTRIFGQTGTKKTLSELIKHPFTQSFSQLKSWSMKIEVHDLKLGRNIMEDYSVECAPLLHADPSWGFRFELSVGTVNKTVVYCTDTGPCKNLVRLALGADALITKCSMLPGTLTDLEWPHLTPEGAAYATSKAGCRRLFLTHFDAQLYNTIQDRYRVQRIARRIFPRTFIAQDMMSVEI